MCFMNRFAVSILFSEVSTITVFEDNDSKTNKQTKQEEGIGKRGQKETFKSSSLAFGLHSNY